MAWADAWGGPRTGKIREALGQVKRGREGCITLAPKPTGSPKEETSKVLELEHVGHQIKQRLGCTTGRLKTLKDGFRRNCRREVGREEVKCTVDSGGRVGKPEGV